MKAEKYKLIKLFPNSHANVGTVKFTWQWESNDVDASRWPEFFEKVKEPLMVTVDGKEMFDEDDEIYYFTGFDNAIVSMFVSHAMNHLSTKFFSTRELAKKYQKENEPKFSEKQIFDAIYNSGMVVVNSIEYIDLCDLKKELGI